MGKEARTSHSSIELRRNCRESSGSIVMAKFHAESINGAVQLFTMMREGNDRSGVCLFGTRAPQNRYSEGKWKL